MFKKLVAIENTLLHEDALKKLSDYAACVELHDERAADEDELIRRIGDADAVLVSFKTTISKTVLDACPNIRYIGMCCTLYEQACNVDLTEARKLGITVTGVRDYGDEGVVEYAISELVRFLHGFGECQWKPVRQELTRQKVGVIGLGRTGRMLADAFRFLGADVAYYSRTRKTDAEEAGIAYHPLQDLLRHSDIVFTCLPRNTRLLGEEEFRLMGNGRILLNTSIGPTFDVAALKAWLTANDHSFYFCDGTGMGTAVDELSGHPQVMYTPVVAGSSAQSIERLSRKALANIEAYLRQNGEL